MQTLVDKLKKFGCRDIQTTIDRFLGDGDFYYSILVEMVQDAMFKELGQAIENSDLNAAFEAAHTIKGVVANCGITPMLDTVVKIVEPLRIGKSDGVKENYAELLKQRDKLAKLLDSINTNKL